MQEPEDTVTISLKVTLTNLISLVMYPHWHPSAVSVGTQYKFLKGWVIEQQKSS